MISKPENKQHRLETTMKDKNYRNMTKTELLAKAKELNITGRWDMNKEALIQAIEDNSRINESEYRDPSNPQTKTTIDYAKTVKAGTLIAFNLILAGKKRVLSAKVKGAQLDKGKASYLFVETKNGSKYRISVEDIIWVKTGQRWPKWVLEALKSDAQVVQEG